MSALRRLWQRLSGARRMVGKDLEGNRFYEQPSALEDARSRRVVEFTQVMEPWEYPSAQRRLPVQWAMWLSHTRLHPPTIEELQADVVRQARVKENVALIEARDRAERERQLSARQALQIQQPATRRGSVTDQNETELGSSDPSGPEMHSSTPSAAVTPTSDTTHPPANDPWKAADTPQETQAWAPAIGRRRG